MRSNIAKVLTALLMTTATIGYAAQPDFQGYLQSSFDRNVQSLTHSSFADFIESYRNNSNELNRMYSEGILAAEIKKNAKLFKDAGFLVVEKKGKLFSYPDYASVIIVPGLDKKWKDYLTLQIKLKPQGKITPEIIREAL